MGKFNKVLILGGMGLVGKATCQKILSEGVMELTVVFLGSAEEDRDFELLRKKHPRAKINRETGNIFFPIQLKDKLFSDFEFNQIQLNLLKNHLFGTFSEETVKGAYIYQLISKYKPEVVIDCVNSASQLAYCRLFENHDSLIYLTRFFQILYQTLNIFPGIVSHFVKIGTTGTGGMGFNIPYTHGEAQPSQPLLLKSAVSGAYTQLLLLLARTPGMPAVIELKPGAAIAWGEINFGLIKKGSKALNLDKNFRDVSLNDFSPSELDDDPKMQSNQLVEAPYLDSGENGLFALEEFRTITALGQMEFVRPEEIANLVWLELNGKSTGRNVINALESSILPPSYVAGMSRQEAIGELEKLASHHQVPSIAFELLGPPRLSKLLFEAFLILAVPSNEEKNPREVAQSIERYLEAHREILLPIISTGIPILLSNGKSLYRGSFVKVKPNSKNDMEKTIRDGWIDFRENNLKLWQERIKKFLKNHPKEDLKPGNLAAFVFSTESDGYRIA